MQTRIGVSKQKTREHPEAEGEREEALHCSCTKLELGVTEQLGGLRTPTKRKSTDPREKKTKGHDVT